MLKKIYAMAFVVLMVISFVGCQKAINTAGIKSVPVLKWYIPGDSQPGLASVLDEFNKISEKKIGAKLDIVYVDQGAYSERMKVNMAAGDNYDLCFTGFLNAYVDAAKIGGLYCIDELLKTTPDLVASIDDYAWKAAKYNGKTYAVPNMQIHAKATCLAFLKKYVDKYGFDVSSVKKTTDIEPFLEKIKQNEPDLYAFRTSWGTTSFNSLDVGSIDDAKLYGSKSIFTLAGNGDKVSAMFTFDAMNMLKRSQILHDWFVKGYIRKDVATVIDDEQARISGKYAVWNEVYKPGLEAEYKNNSGLDIVVAQITPAQISSGSVRATMIGVGNKSKHPQEAIKMIELLNTDKEAYNLICYGIEGKHYKKTGDNRIEPIPNSNYNPNASWKFGNQFNAYLLPTQADDVWELTKKMNKSAYISPLFGFDADLDSVKSEYAQCESIIGQYKILNNGSEDPKPYYEEYVSKLKNAGAQKILDTVQAQIDKFLKQ